MLLLLVALMSFARAASARQPERQADTIFLNADIYTGFEISAAPRPRALAVAGDRILALGTEEEIRRYKGRRTKLVDLGGHFVMPGFNDAHLHLAGGGLEKLSLDLTGSASRAEMLARASSAAAGLAPGQWLFGRGWDHTLWADRRLPDRHDLDAVTASHPTILVRVDGHIGVANSAALLAAGIVKEKEDPEGGRIDRAPDGSPTGILRETALELVVGKMPPPTPAQRRRAIKLALRDAAEHGITSLQDNSTWEDFLVYEELEQAGELTARITEWLPFPAPLEQLRLHRAHHPQTDPMLHTGMLKGFLDGSLGSRTAALLATYADDPGNRGLLQFDAAKLRQLAEERAGAGFQLGFHAIGDAAVSQALDIFADLRSYAAEHNPLGLSPGAGDYRFRVEHAQVVAPGDVARFGDLHVVVSLQPNHLLTDMNWALDRLGAERARHSYPWKDLQDAGVTLAFGTDYPVEPLTPFRGVYAAVTRRNETGTKEYFPVQKLGIQQAIAAYTSGSAFAEFAEKDKGKLQAGMLADFVVLDRDITRVAPGEILQIRVLRTVVGGRTVYDTQQTTPAAKPLP